MTDCKKYNLIVLAGGFGKRLWPISSKSLPKQFIKINNYSLFQQSITNNILKNGNQLNSIVIITSEKHRFIVREQLKEINIDKTITVSIILENFSKNTAVALTYSMLHLTNNFPTLIVSADHLIKKISQYKTSISRGLNLISINNIVLFGKKPLRPTSDYGYFKIDRHKVKSFIEKPNSAKAKKIYKLENYLWNCGIFATNKHNWLSMMSEFEAINLDLIRRVYRTVYKDISFFRLKSYKNQKQISCNSIDYAVLEKINSSSNFHINAAALNCEWDDLGDIDRFLNYYNINKKNLILYNSKNILSFSKSKTIFVSDLEDIAIVESNDCILIKKVGSKFHADDNLFDKFYFNNIIYRPWGYFEIITTNENYVIKKLVVSPGQKISLQYHLYRSEHWVIVDGQAQITKGNKVYQLIKNDSISIEKEELHRIENSGNNDLIIIEIQLGDLLKEHDIVRVEDDYQRK